MFESLTQRLSGTIDRLRGRGRLTEENIREATREVRIALLEADVALPVVQALVERIKVRAVGFLPAADLPTLYSTADILLFPSQAESFGLTPLEAASCGAVPVLFGVGPLAENTIDGVTGVVVPPFDTDFFAAKIAALLNDVDARDRLSKAGHEHIMKEFDPETVAKNYFELFGKITRPPVG